MVLFSVLGIARESARIAWVLVLAVTGVLWDNDVPDSRRGIWAHRGDSVVTVVDDIIVKNEVWHVETIAWRAIDVEFDWAGKVDVLIFPDFGGRPGEKPVVELLDLGDDLARQETGEDFHGFPVLEYRLEKIDIMLSRGTWWVGLRPVGGENSTGGSAWLSSHTVPYEELNGSEIYWRCADCGVPEFIPGSEILGQQHDVNFQIFGTALSQAPAIRSP